MRGLAICERGRSCAKPPGFHLSRAIRLGLLAILTGGLGAVPGAASATVVFLTSGSSWTVPSDWNNASNTVECVGAGGTGNIGVGGVGGGYAKRSSVTLTPGGSVSYAVGTATTTLGSTGGDTWFSSTTVLECAGGGSGGSNHGDVTHTGGAGGTAGTTHDGPGGGGAAGPNGNGAAGGNTTSTTETTAGAGGSADGGNAAGGAGGANKEVYGGSKFGLAGSSEALWTQTSNSAVAGPGGGGGGSGSGFPNAAAQGGAGGLYGGGSGSPGRGSPDVTSNVAGQPGIIVITYTPAASGPADLAVTAAPTPVTAISGAATTVSGTVQNVGGASSAAVQSYFQFLDASHNCTTPNFCGTVYANTGALAAGASAPVSVSYTYPVTGTYGVRLCTNYNNVDSETNTTDDCGPWATVTVTTGGGVAGTTNLTYDVLGRLTCTATPDAYTNSYVLDPADNRTQVVRNTSACTSANLSQPPVANNVSATVLENSGANWITLRITGGTATAVSVIGSAAHGTATASSAQISYTPTNGYAGSDSFQYKATNPAGTSAAATVSINVGSTASGQPPVVNSSGPVSVLYGSSNNAMPLNITGGTPLGVTILQPPHYGTVAVNGASVTYTPTIADPGTGASTNDSFAYKANNLYGESGSAGVSITIDPAPFSANDIGPVTVGYNSYNNNVGPVPAVDGVYTTVRVYSQPISGSLASSNGSWLLYTPSTGFSGSDNFKYQIFHGSQASAPGTVHITVNGPPTGGSPTANPDTQNITGANYISTAVASGCLDPTANDTSPSNYPLTVISVTQPNGATPYGSVVSWTSGSNSVCYGAHTPNSPTGPPGGWSDTFTYTISDGHGGTATGLVTFNVTIPPP